MSNISVLAQNLKSSEIIKIAFEVNGLKRKGEDIANLTIGDFDSNLSLIEFLATNFEILRSSQCNLLLSAVSKKIGNWV